ncbi:hypothetical protein WDZ92_45935 [Nostoc sp. NIES-2111]
MPAAAIAGTDWSIAARSWSDQLQELRVADAARRLCGVQAPAASVSLLRTTARGLEQALRPLGSTGGATAPVAAAGGRKAFCADATLMAQAKATLAALAGQTLPDNPTAPPKPAMAADAPTPVIDPDVPLIRGCRDAVNRMLGAKRTNNRAFWAKYEACIADSGAGW